MSSDAEKAGSEAQPHAGKNRARTEIGQVHQGQREKVNYCAGYTLGRFVVRNTADFPTNNEAARKIYFRAASLFGSLVFNTCTKRKSAISEQGLLSISRGIMRFSAINWTEKPSYYQVHHRLSSLVLCLMTF